MSEQAMNSTGFYNFLNEHKLMATRCKQDGTLYLPPRAVCPQDYRSDMEWVELSGRGRLAAFSVIAIGPSFMIEAGYDRKNPYCAGVVELEEGPSISAQILGVDVTRPESIQIGMPLELAFVQRGPQDHQATFLAFRPAGGAPLSE